jgi:hypothetical protein
MVRIRVSPLIENRENAKCRETAKVKSNLPIDVQSQCSLARPYMNNNNNNSRSAKAAPTKSKPRKPAAKRPNGQPNGARPKVPVSTGSSRPAFAAAAYASGQTTRAPDIIRNSVSSCRIRHRELIASVTGSVAFTVASTLAINPGIAASFPWLSVEAQGWERYRFNRLSYCYYTRTGSNVPGSVILAPDYDAADAAPSSEQVASAFQDTAEDAPWKDIVCRLKPESMHPRQGENFIRTTALAANLDIKTYDAGNLFVCTIDGTAVPWGKLWVEYDVEFFTPQLPSAGAVTIAGGLVTGANTMTQANPFGIVPVVDTQAVGLAMSAASVLSFSQLGTYLLSWRVAGTVITVFPTPTGALGATVTTLGGFIDAGAVAAIQMIRVVVDTVGATVSFSLTATTVTTSLAYVGIAPTSSLA